MFKAAVAEYYLMEKAYSFLLNWEWSLPVQKLAELGPYILQISFHISSFYKGI